MIDYEGYDGYLSFILYVKLPGLIYNPWEQRQYMKSQNPQNHFILLCIKCVNDSYHGLQSIEGCVGFDSRGGSILVCWSCKGSLSLVGNDRLGGEKSVKSAIQGHQSPPT